MRTYTRYIVTTLTVGALFAGYGGLELALAEVLDVELAWRRWTRRDGTIYPVPGDT